MTTANEYTSTFNEYCLLSRSYGAIQCKVPKAIVIIYDSGDRDNPKSATFAIHSLFY